MLGPMPPHHPCHVQRLVTRWDLEDLASLDTKEAFLKLVQTPLHSAFGGMNRAAKVSCLLAIQQIREAAAMLITSIPGARECLYVQKLMWDQSSQRFLGRVENQPRSFPLVKVQTGLIPGQVENSKVNTYEGPRGYDSCRMEPEVGANSSAGWCIGNQMGLTLEMSQMDLTSHLVSQPSLIDEIPIDNNVNKPKSKRRRLMFATRTKPTAKPVQTSTRGSRAPKSTTFSVSITASPANFAQSWKRSIGETKFGDRGLAKKQRLNTTDQKARELSKLLADNIINKSSKCRAPSFGNQTGSGANSF